MNVHEPAGKDKQIIAGLALQTNGQYLEAISEYQKSPEQHFATKLIGECFEAIGEFNKAREFYRISTELLPENRMRPSLNDFLRDLALQERFHLVDLERAAENLSPNQIPGSDLFIDYCHMNWRGYYLMSQELLTAIQGSDLIHCNNGESLAKPSMEEIIQKKGWEALSSNQ